MFPLFEWYAWQCCQPAAVVFVIDCARFTNTRKCSGESPTILPIHDIDVPGVACRTSYLISFSQKNKIQMGEPGQQSSLHTFRGFHRRGCAGSGWRGQRRAGKRHVSLSFGLMRYDFENCEFSTTTFQRAKTKSQKIPERAIVAVLMPGAPFRAFNGYRLVFSIVRPPFRQLTATIVSSSAKAKNKVESKQDSKIILNRLKSCIEYMANLGREFGRLHRG